MCKLSANGFAKLKWLFLGRIRALFPVGIGAGMTIRLAVKDLLGGSLAVGACLGGLEILVEITRQHTVI